MAKIAIIGGGIGGTAAAITLSKGGASVTIFEQNTKICKKLLATGNGRCNFSNADIDGKFYYDGLFDRINAKHAFFASDVNAAMYKDAESTSFNSGKSAHNRCDNPVVRFFRSVGVLEYVDEYGRIYPRTQSAATVRDALVYELNRLGVKVVTDCRIEAIAFEKNTAYPRGRANNPLGDGILDNHERRANSLFSLKHTFGDDVFDGVVIAVGSDAQARTNLYDLLPDKYFAPVVPALVPLQTKNSLKRLDGLRVKCKVSLLRSGELIYSECGEVQFRDFGLSGIAVFNCSSYIARDVENIDKYAISLDLFDDWSYVELQAALEERKRFSSVPSIYFNGLLAYGLADYIIGRFNIRKIESNEVCKILKSLDFSISGLRGLDCAQVAHGGIKSEFLSDELCIHGYEMLYACGEAVNVDGLCGGYNIHWAVLSGMTAGYALLRRISYDDNSVKKLK
ncbi:MAG: NAD(P)/FAD-dependent oxidoreductase [Clostridia bacterium]|nr:NAD(P)/FAD-dependent oxidoreductase [Clostridia bacterium]